MTGVPEQSGRQSGGLTEREARSIRMAEKALIDTETLAGLLRELIGELRDDISQAKEEVSRRDGEL